MLAFRSCALAGVRTPASARPSACQLSHVCMCEAQIASERLLARSLARLLACSLARLLALLACTCACARTR
eukprot:4776805-Alexandrium_andersonii.AAC.1